MTGTADVAPHRTLQALINETRDLSAAIIASTRSAARVIITGVDKVATDLADELVGFEHEKIQEVKKQSDSAYASLKAAYSDILDHSLEVIET